MTFREDLLRSLRSGLAVAVLLALGVGLILAIGANLSNATPSKDKPFGWPGAANFEGGVATVRPGLVLATTLPAMLLGLRMVGHARSRTQTPASQVAEPQADSPLASMLAGGILIGGALLMATGIGAWAASPSPSGTYYAFWVAHTVLALASFSLGFLCRAASPRHGAVAAMALWTLFAVLLDDYVRWQLFRSEGYDNLAAGRLPGWFYATQVLSPIAAYRALLIVWQPGFRDWVERAALDGATLPGWLNPLVLTSVILVLWVAVPLAAAWLLLRRRRRGTPNPLLPLLPLAGAGTSAPTPTPESAAPLLDVMPAQRPDRPPATRERRPRLNAHQRVAHLRAVMRPPRPRA